MIVDKLVTVGRTMGTQLGMYLQSLRRQQGASIRQLGSQVGLSASHVSLIERGQRQIAIYTLYLLVQALHGDFNHALCLLALDAGVPEEMFSPPPT